MIILWEANTYFPVYRAGSVLNTPVLFFTDNIYVAKSYTTDDRPEVSSWKLTLKNTVSVDFSRVDGWWFPKEDVPELASSWGVDISFLYKFHGGNPCKDIKTDFLAKAAKALGKDGIIFYGIRDKGSGLTNSKEIALADKRSTEYIIFNPSSARLLSKRVKV